MYINLLYFLILNQGYVFIDFFKERGRETEKVKQRERDRQRQRQKHQSVASRGWPDRESDPQHFAVHSEV